MPILLSLFPILILLILGTGLKRTNFLSNGAWRGLEQLVYYVFLPALIIKVLASAPGEAIDWRFAVALLFSQIAMFVLSLAWLNVHRALGPRSGSVIQSNVRWNTFVALALADTMFGQAGLALVALGVVVLIPLANVFSVIGFLSNSDEGSASYSNMAQGLLKNPLLIACLIGIAIWLLQAPMLVLIGDVLDLLSSPTIALGLLTAGAGLKFTHVSSEWRETKFWSAFRLLIFPALALSLCWLFGVSLIATQIAIICAATPTAVNGYILAKELGGDYEFSASLIAAQTFLSLLTIPLFLNLAVWVLA